MLRTWSWIFSKNYLLWASLKNRRISLYQRNIVLRISFAKIITGRAGKSSFFLPLETPLGSVSSKRNFTNFLIFLFCFLVFALLLLLFIDLFLNFYLYFVLEFRFFNDDFFLGAMIWSQLPTAAALMQVLIINRFEFPPETYITADQDARWFIENEQKVILNAAVTIILWLVQFSCFFFTDRRRGKESYFWLWKPASWGNDESSPNHRSVGRHVQGLYEMGY